METPKYIISAGVRVPANWTVEELGKALAKRKIAFTNEKEIMDAFGDALRIKEQLESAIEQLRGEKTRISFDVASLDRQKEKLQSCPHCKQLLSDKIIIGGGNNAKRTQRTAASRV